MRNNWHTKKLSEVTQYISRGISPKYTEKNGLCVLNQKCIRDHKVNTSLSRLHDENAKKVVVDKFLCKGDVLVNSTGTGTLGRVAQVQTCEDKITVDSHITIIRPSTHIFYLPYFGYALIYIEDLLKQLGEGTSGQTELSRSTVSKLEISYPEKISEQKRIVKILDDALGKIEKAKENTEKNLKNAKELFESYLQGVFADSEKDWEEKKLGDVCDTGAGGTPLKAHKDYYENGNIPWLRSGEVCKKYISKSELFITAKGFNNSSARKFPQNTVLVAMYGATAGQTGILKFESTTNQAVCGILPNKSFIPEYIYYIFRAKKKELVKQAVGGAQPNISQIKIKDTYIPVLSLSKQKSIVAKLGALSAETKKLEEIYQMKLENLSELRKSILEKAFRGEL